MASSVAVLRNSVVASKKKSTSSSKKLSYSLGGMEMKFSTTSPNQNNVYSVGVAHPRGSHPAVGTSAESKIT